MTKSNLFTIVSIILLNATISSYALKIKGAENLIDKPKQEQQQSKIVTATGIGISVEKATKNALRSAVDMVVSSLIDANTKIENDEVIQDSILQLSRGLVSDYEVIKTWQEDGLTHIQIKATVNRNDIVTKLSEKNLYKEDVDGKGLSKGIAKIEIKQDNTEAAKEYISKTLSKLPACVISAKMIGDPEVIKTEGEGENKSATIKLKYKIFVDDEKYNDFYNQITEGLKKCAKKATRKFVKLRTNSRGPKPKTYAFPDYLAIRKKNSLYIATLDKLNNKLNFKIFELDGLVSKFLVNNNKNSDLQIYILLKNNKGKNLYEDSFNLGFLDMKSNNYSIFGVRIIPLLNHKSSSRFKEVEIKIPAKEVANIDKIEFEISNAE